MELCVRWATAFTPALATACAPTGTLDLVPRLRPLLGLSACQPLPRGPSGLQGTDQRRGCPGPVGTRGRALSRLAARPPPWRSLSIHWNRSQASLSSCLGLAQGRRPLWGSGTLHCTGSLHTGWGACTPHTHLQRVGPPTYPPHWGPTLYPAGWEDQGLSQGIAPQGRCREAGRCRGEGPALAVTSTFDQILLLCPLPLGLVPGPPCPGGHLGPGLSGCLPAALARAGAMASGSNEAK